MHYERRGTLHLRFGRCQASGGGASRGEDLQLPITLHFSTVAKDGGHVSDETAAEVLRRLEDFGEAYSYRDGKMWLPNSLAYTLLMKYPTAIQGLFLQ